MPEKRNTCIVLSCFKRVSTVLFISVSPARERSANSHQKGGQMFAWARSFKGEGENLCSDNSGGAVDWQLSLLPRWLLTAPSLAVSSEDQHSCKPELRAAGTGCAWVTLTLILQPEAVSCSSSHFRFGFEKICLLEARHEASTWGKKMKNMRVKAINHTVVSILYSCTEGNQEKHQQKQSKPEQRRKLSETATPSSSKN